jgi:hypothetical protein
MGLPVQSYLPPNTASPIVQNDVFHSDLVPLDHQLWIMNQLTTSGYTHLWDQFSEMTRSTTRVELSSRGFTIPGDVEGEEWSEKKSIELTLALMPSHIGLSAYAACEIQSSTFDHIVGHPDVGSALHLAQIQGIVIPSLFCEFETSSQFFDANLICANLR